MTKSKEAVGALAVTEPGPMKFIRKNPGRVPYRSYNSNIKRDLMAETRTAKEIEEFFTEAEREEKKRFMNKYNYDVVKDAPMEGRYEWALL
ncbi:cyclin-dependent kinase inhibitor 7-like [Asparagus officinalis]|uniref:cyclin-dependent kinase inhibitor 7-like n=1 Tax=Asparagus officinalis TaxID=4686 RepID=UPI00098DE84D|nr:cyclin-dependent kinase inhibitor 7-like [Asparagus officinalis]